MKRLLLFWLLALAMSACKTDLRHGASARATGNTYDSAGIETKGLVFVLSGIRNCLYPVNDPLFEKRKNSKLVLIQVLVQCREKSDKNSVIPAGATLTDNRGNEYGSSPSVIAMAQTGSCIGNDDIRDYNAIWNGNIVPGEKYRAWILGFEMPRDAVPEKLFWNLQWKNDGLFFDFNKTNYAIND